MTQHLSNYLRTFRRRAGLTQDEVAWLLGSQCGTRVSRYEQDRRLPVAATVFALEVAFRAPARELFAGVYAEIERTTVARALELAERLRPRADRRTGQKLEALEAIYLRETKPSHHDGGERT